MTNDLDNIKTWDDYREFIQEKAKKIFCQIQQPLSLLLYVILIVKCVMFI